MKVELIVLLIGLLLFIVWQNCTSKPKETFDKPSSGSSASLSSMCVETELKDGDEVVEKILSGSDIETQKNKKDIKETFTTESSEKDMSSGAKLSESKPTMRMPDLTHLLSSGEDLQKTEILTTQNTSYGEQPALVDGPIYFKPTGDMGDNASGKHGLLNQLAATSGNVKVCNRFYCYGCGDEDACPHSTKEDTDDIRRNYFKFLTDLRAHRNNEYPFYNLRGSK